MVEAQTPPLHVAARATVDLVEAAGVTSPLAAAVAANRADLLAEQDAQQGEA